MLLAGWMHAHRNGRRFLPVALERAAGVYHDVRRSAALDLQRTVLLVLSTYSYRDFLYNWICHAERHGLQFLVVALDREMYAHATKYAVNVVLPDSAPTGVIGEDITWLSRSARNFVLHSKIRLMRRVVSL